MPVTKMTCPKCGHRYNLPTKTAQEHGFVKCPKCGFRKPKMTKQDMEKDILILVLRLLGENPDTFSEETAEVMERWSGKARDVLNGNHVYEV